MIRNHLKIAWRNLTRNMQFSILNILGLSTGLACVLFIYLWVTDEMNVDAFHVNKNRIYEVMGHIKLPDGIHTQEQTPALLAASLATDISQVEMATAVYQGGENVLSLDDKKVNATPHFVDDNFFRVFSFSIIEGNKETPLKDKHRVLLSEQLAFTLFGNNHPYSGKKILWGEKQIPYMVAGTFKKPASNSTQQFELLFHYDLFKEQQAKDISWQNSFSSAYLLLKNADDADVVSRQISGYLQTKDKKAPLFLTLRRYADRYLYGKYENGVLVGGRIEYVRLFTIVACLILVLACINFMNLSTAKASRRMKEVGIKKVAGASRADLIGQYMVESMLMSMIAAVLALSFVTYLLPQFNSIVGKEIVFPFHVSFIATMIVIILLTGILAGSYPALYLSSFKPVSVLKGKLHASFGESGIRKSLVVFQFAISVVFIIAVYTVYQQMSLIQNKNLGYSKENIISIKNDGGISRSFQAFTNEVHNVNGVLDISAFYGDLNGNTSGNTEHFEWEGQQSSQAIQVNVMDVDDRWIPLLNIRLKAGRNFSNNAAAEQSSIVVNQAAIEAMGLKDAIGKTVTLWSARFRIIGVAENFHYESLYEKVKPCLMRLATGGSNILVKVAGGNEKEKLGHIEKIYKKYNPGVPFDYTFLDQDYQRMYVAEQRVAQLSRWFAVLAITISCLGLFGLASFTAEKRQKEIGIRKVIGASVVNILGLLSVDFLKLILIAFIVALPLSWWLMNQWLNEFAYRIDLSPEIFIIASFAVFLITILTVCFQSLKAALMNPVRSLRLNE